MRESELNTNYFDEILIRANQGDPEAQVELGLYYLEHDQNKPNYRKAHRWLTLASDAGSGKAKFYLGYLYEIEQDFIDQDLEEAMRWYEIAANYGYAYALYHLGVLYYEGRYIPKNEVKAHLYFFRGAVQNDPDAQFMIGKYFLSTAHRFGDFQQAINYFTLASEQGHQEAIYLLFNELFYNKPGRRNRELALEWIKKGVELGDDKCLMHLAHIYEKIEPWKNDEKAMELYLKGTERELDEAMFHLGNYYQLGYGPNKQIDLVEAVKWYEEGAKYQNENCLVALANLYMNGIGVWEDFEKGFNYYLQASSLGHLQAQYQTGNCYEEGIGTTQDLSFACYYFQKAAQGKHPFALFKMGKYYEQGLVLTQDKVLALQYYQEADALGVSGATVAIGQLIEEGLVIKQDYLQAKNLYLKAAKQKDLDAMFYLGSLYERGVLDVPDYDLAYHWYLKAAKKEHPIAQYRLALLAFQELTSFLTVNLGVSWMKKSAENEYPLAILWIANDLNDDKYYEEAYSLYLLLATDEKMTRAMYEIGLLFLNGSLGEKNYESAIEWLQQAGDGQYGPANYRLGLLYYLGQGVTKDHIKAESYFRSGANQDCAECAYYLGVLSFDENEPFFNYEEGKKWFTKAIELKNDEALNVYGSYLIQGIPEQNISLGLAYLKEGSYNGHAGCMVALAEIYLEGKVVEKDLTKAHTYALKAAMKDHPRGSELHVLLANEPVDFNS